MGGRSKEDRKQLKETPLEKPTSLPCWKGHNHDWPTEGPITKEHVGRCQVYCQFCSLNVSKPTKLEAKWGWHLRRHIYQVHRKEFPDLIVPEEWSGKKETSKGKVGPRKGETTKSTKEKTTKAAKKAAKTPEVTAPMMPTTSNLQTEEVNPELFVFEVAVPTDDVFALMGFLAAENDLAGLDFPPDVICGDMMAADAFEEPVFADFVEDAVVEVPVCAGPAVEAVEADLDTTVFDDPSMNDLFGGNDLF